MSSPLESHARAILKAAIRSVQPDSVMDCHVRLDGQRLSIDDLAYDLSTVRRLCILGAGKASAAMAATLEGILGDRIADGCVITKYGHSAPCQNIAIHEAGHPVVDQNGLDATAEVLRSADSLDDRDLAIVLLSGGASALLERFPPSIPLGDAQRTFELLLRSGANINEMNAVRKHISMVKGGQLARALSPCPSVTLIISDVIGSPLDVIGSGPTAPDRSTFRDASEVLERFGLIDEIPRTVSAHLLNGEHGLIPETPKPGDLTCRLAEHRIVASNDIALDAALREAIQLGYDARVTSSTVSGEARKLARNVATNLKESALSRPGPICLLYGGEMTVAVRGDGLGGRCQEFCVAAHEQMRDFKQEFLIAAIGTDGTDGPTDAAGGMVTLESRIRADAKQLSARDFLARNDSYHFLEAIDTLIITGPTGTNVMDICVAMLP